MTQHLFEASNLSKRYGDAAVVRDLSFGLALALTHRRFRG